MASLGVRRFGFFLKGEKRRNRASAGRIPTRGGRAVEWLRQKIPSRRPRDRTRGRSKLLCEVGGGGRWEMFCFCFWSVLVTDALKEEGEKG